MASSNIMYSKGLTIKMEEQTVPSAGFSPLQSDAYESNYSPKYMQSDQYGPMMSSVEDHTPYGNLADTFDLSLLGDFGEDHDMATVPSPGSWLPAASFEQNSWNTMSLYAPSPLGSDCYNRVFSPDSKPLLTSAQSSPLHSAYESSGNISILCHSPQTPASAMSPVSVSETDRNLLLRQCLEDTTFQRKVNFKPMDLPAGSLLGETDLLAIRDGLGSSPAGSSTSAAAGSVGTGLELNQIEPMFSLAFEQIQADIENTCTALVISPDPSEWSGPDVQSWLSHTLSSLPGGGSLTMGGTEPGAGLLAGFWNTNGRALVAYSEEEFRRRDPVNGDRVFAQLELWKLFQGKGYAGPQTGPDFDLDTLLLGSPAGSPDLLSEENGRSSFSSGSSDVSSMTEAGSPGSYSSPPEPMPTDDEEEEEEVVEKKPVVPGKKTGPGTNKSGAHIHLWQFLKELLASPQQNGSCIRWLDQARGVFKIEDSVRVARLWGLRKNRPAMNYDKLSRSIRQYYRKGIMRKTERSQRLVYQFCHPYGL